MGTAETASSSPGSSVPGTLFQSSVMNHYRTTVVTGLPDNYITFLSFFHLNLVSLTLSRPIFSNTLNPANIPGLSLSFTLLGISEDVGVQAAKMDMNGCDQRGASEL